MSELPLPKDPRHQRFADLVMHGTAAAAAYRQAGFKVTSAKSASAAASRMLTNVSIQKYMAAVRQESAQATVLSVAEKRNFLARIVRTPLMAIDPNHPDRKDGDLILKYKRTASETGETEEIVKLDPLKAIDQDNKLSGDDPEANALQQMAESLALLGRQGGTLPGDRM